RAASPAGGRARHRAKRRYRRPPRATLAHGQGDDWRPYASPVNRTPHSRELMRTTFAFGPTAMARFLIILGLAILVIGLLWPYLTRIGFGRLPGDIVIERDNATFYVPIMTCLILSLLFSLILWLVNR